jgi:hypothetical protein
MFFCQGVLPLGGGGVGFTMPKEIHLPSVFLLGFSFPQPESLIWRRWTLTFHRAPSATSMFSPQNLLPRGHHEVGELGFAGRALRNRWRSGTEWCAPTGISSPHQSHLPAFGPLEACYRGLIWGPVMAFPWRDCRKPWKTSPRTVSVFSECTSLKSRHFRTYVKGKFIYEYFLVFKLTFYPVTLRTLLIAGDLNRSRFLDNAIFSHPF